MKNLIDIYESLLDDEETMMANADKAATVGHTITIIDKILQSKDFQQYSKSVKELMNFLDLNLGNGYRPKTFRSSKTQSSIHAIWMAEDNKWIIVIDAGNGYIVEITWANGWSMLLKTEYRTTISSRLKLYRNRCIISWLLKGDWLELRDKIREMSIRESLLDDNFEDRMGIQYILYNLHKCKSPKDFKTKIEALKSEFDGVAGTDYDAALKEAKRMGRGKKTFVFIKFVNQPCEAVIKWDSVDHDGMDMICWNVHTNQIWWDTDKNNNCRRYAEERFKPKSAIDWGVWEIDPELLKRK